MGYIPKAFVQYIQRESSITKYHDERLFNYIENFNGLIKYYKDNNYYHDYYFELEYSYIRYLYATFIKQISYTNDKELFEKALNEAISNVKHNFPNYRKNPYLKELKAKNIYLKYFNPFLAKLIYLKNQQ